MWRTIFLCALAIGCVARLSAAAPTKSIDLHTIESLAAFAAKDKLCRDLVAKSRREIAAKFAAENPHAPPLSIIPKVHSYDLLPGEVSYARCIYETARDITACQATSEDFGTLRTLMDRDKRLAIGVGFDEVVADIRQHCPNGMKLSARESARSWPRYKLRRCERYGNQPVLIAEAIHIPINGKLTLNASDRLWEKARDCRKVWGKAFASGTLCSVLADRKSRIAHHLPVPDLERLGIEEYFCPDESTAAAEGGASRTSPTTSSFPSADRGPGSGRGSRNR